MTTWKDGKQVVVKVPQGLQGGKGDKGDQGNPGPQGLAGDVSTAAGTITYGIAGTPLFKSRWGGGTDTNWKKILTCTMPAGTYKGAAYDIVVLTGWYSPGGYSAPVGERHRFEVNVMRSGGVDLDRNTAYLTGSSTDFVRVVKTLADGTQSIYEVQVRIPDQYKMIEVEARELANPGPTAGVVTTWAVAVVDGATTGTIYTPGMGVGYGNAARVGGLLPSSSGAAWSLLSTDANGNTGLGAAPSAWGGSMTGVLELGTSAVTFAKSLAVGYITANLYHNGTAWIHKATGTGAIYRINSSGGHEWIQAVSKTAGSGSSNVTSMMLDGSGRLGLGGTPYAWATDYCTMDLGAAAAIESYVGSLGFNIVHNAYKDTSQIWRYKLNGAVCAIQMIDDGFKILSAPVGTAGASFNYLVAAVFAAGHFGINVTPAAWRTSTKALQVNAASSLGGYSFGGGYSTILYHNLYHDVSNNLIYQNASTGSLYIQTGGEHQFWSAPSGSAGATATAVKNMTLDASGNLLLDNGTLKANKVGANIRLKADGSDAKDGGLYADASGNIYFGSWDAARVLKFGPSGNTYVTSGPSSGYAFTVTNSVATNPMGLSITFSGASSSGNYFLQCGDTGATRFAVLGSGNCQNVNNSYGAISDIKLKENIADAPSYWEKFLLYRFVNYTLKSDPEERKLLGLIAQEAEVVSPGVVEETRDLILVQKVEDGKPVFEQKVITPAVFNEAGDELSPAILGDDPERPVMVTEETGGTTKGVKYSVVTLQAEVVLQEAQRRIVAIEEELQAARAESVGLRDQVAQLFAMVEALTPA